MNDSPWPTVWQFACACTLLAVLALLFGGGCVTERRIPIRVTAEGDPVDPIEGCREVCLTHCEGQICTNTGLDVKAAVVLPDRRVGCLCQPFPL